MAGLNAKSHPIGKGSVFFILVVVLQWLFLALSMFVMEAAPVGIGMLILWVLIAFFNRSTLFSDSQEFWLQGN
ncbi:hypothetical protein [Paracoccus sp. J55]|uniref:hypothetical protein n=1 Tax=Paracoccus sp. J55 TaxID=935849 RepID=UPI0012EBA61A|nr:hypothetical protein [Paracoccus sp. J55]